MCGNTTELGNVGKNPKKSSLFSLTVYDPGIGLPGDRVECLVKHLNLRDVWCVLNGP